MVSFETLTCSTKKKEEKHDNAQEKWHCVIHNIPQFHCTCIMTLKGCSVVFYFHLFREMSINNCDWLEAVQGNYVRWFISAWSKVLKIKHISGVVCLYEMNSN